MRISWRVAILLGAVLMWLAASACSCGSALERLGQSSPREPVVLTPQPPTVSPRAGARPSPAFTLAPTLTPAPVAKAPSAAPTETRTGTERQGIPSGPNEPFVLELTEAQVNTELQGQMAEQQGFQVSEAHVTIAADIVTVSLRATHLETGLSTGITLQGVPNVVEGKAYVRITRVTLDDSLDRLTRLLVRAAVEQAVKQASQAEGIPLPTENIEVQQVRLEPGKIVVVGRTR